MATTTTSAPVRILSQAERLVVATALKTLEKSYERAGRASGDDVINAAYVNKAALCSNLAVLFTTGSLDI